MLNDDDPLSNGNDLRYISPAQEKREETNARDVCVYLVPDRVLHVWLRSTCWRVWRAPRAVQTAAATLGGHAASGPFENHGFEWFHSGVRVARRVARVALAPL